MGFYQSIHHVIVTSSLVYPIFTRLYVYHTGHCRRLHTHTQTMNTSTVLAYTTAFGLVGLTSRLWFVEGSETGTHSIVGIIGQAG